MNMKMKSQSKKNQQGQTLIETLVAIFILTTGLIAAVSLAIYSFNGSEGASKQIVATALAREGVEVVKNLRDTNWLTQTLTDCSAQMGAGQKCYPQWLNGLSAGSYIPVYNTQGNSWALSSTTNYTVNYDSTTGLYSNGGTGVATAYSRKVTLSYDTSTAPFSAQNPLLIVNSTVWWRSRKCSATTDPSTLPAGCKVILEMHLANWRNY